MQSASDRKETPWELQVLSPSSTLLLQLLLALFFPHDHSFLHRHVLVWIEKDEGVDLLRIMLDRSFLPNVRVFHLVPLCWLED